MPTSKAEWKHFSLLTLSVDRYVVVLYISWLDYDFPYFRVEFCSFVPCPKSINVSYVAEDGTNRVSRVNESFECNNAKECDQEIVNLPLWHLTLH